MRVGRGATYPMPAQDTAICDASLQRANSETARQAQEELGAVFIAEAASGVVSALSRYETKIERGLFRKLKELRRMQAIHVGEVLTAPAAIDAEFTADSLETADAEQSDDVEPMPS